MLLLLAPVDAAVPVGTEGVGAIVLDELALDAFGAVKVGGILPVLKNV